MPGLDGTGPLGLGPRTGRGLGLCPPWLGPAPRYYGYRGFYGVGRGGYPWGGGRGRTWGGGRGWWWRTYQPYPPVYYAPYYNPAYSYPYPYSPYWW